MAIGSRSSGSWCLKGVGLIRDEDFVGFFYLSTKAKFVVFSSFCRQKFDKNFSFIMHEKLNFGPFYPKKFFCDFHDKHNF